MLASKTHAALTGDKVSDHLLATGVSIAIDTETKLCKTKYHSHMRGLVYGRHLGTRAFHNCKLRLLERVANIPSSGRADV